ncbi:MAG: carbon monoxide dehydrogenase [Elusimicrobia bacterium HGW-Elusimicrobia-1]|jgi:CO dehydrogenase maturation factor|nr:MAG: carbon monoxide dehydrogenase [Elusimicrobia bacterium HGW-Elusimicrobia-1]
MTIRVATAGKGGVGKTTFTALLARAFLEKGARPMLVVDADPNANLNYYLGAAYDATVSDLRESLKRDVPPAGMSKTDFTALKISEILSENNGYDLLAMGRPEGPGCYCFVNEVLRTALSRLASKYAVLLLDNEAGLEHLSRRTTDDLDELFIVSDFSPVALVAAARIKSLAASLELKVKKTSLILNRIKSGSDEMMARKMARDILGADIEIAAVIPELPEIGEMLPQSKNVFSLTSFPKEIMDRITGAFAV